nr:PQQ-like beta-propeller repeat protein [Roseovarius aestuariivivens]
MTRFISLTAICLTAACSSKEVILQGEREDIRDVLVTETGETALAERTVTGEIPPLSLPATRVNAGWTQGVSSPATRVAHPAFSAQPRLAWQVNIGDGDGRRGRITADPVVGDGRIFTLDSKARVSAVSTAGKVLWTRDLTPPNDSGSDASGGGLAYADGQLYVSSGFGLLTALDAASGGEIWQQNLRASGTGSPSVAGDLVYVVAGDEVGWALERDTGRIRWQLGATPDLQNFMGAPAPALSDKYVVFAYGSGEVQGAFRKGGLRRWDAQLAGDRDGFSTGLVGDITGGPVIDGDRVYVGNHAGRTVALSLGNGERLWTAPEGPLNPIWPAGNSIFLVSDRNELLRLSAEDGRRIWGRALPFFTKSKPKRQAEIFAHHGPIIAGGRLIVVSNDGLMRFFDPTNGAPLGQISMPGGATTNPVVAGGTLYVVTTSGQLLAFR